MGSDVIDDARVDEFIRSLEPHFLEARKRGINDLLEVLRLASESGGENFLLQEILSGSIFGQAIMTKFMHRLCTALHGRQATWEEIERALEAIRAKQRHSKVT